MPAAKARVSGLKSESVAESLTQDSSLAGVGKNMQNSSRASLFPPPQKYLCFEVPSVEH